MTQVEGEHPQPPRRFRRLRAWLSRRLLGVDLTSELRALHVAMAEAVSDLGDELRDHLDERSRAATLDVMGRADLLAERADRKTEGLQATLSRRIAALERSGRPMSDRAYAEFENGVRGPEAAVREQLRPIVPHFRIAPVVDLGCGRGELLEELRNAVVPSYGVDSNKTMVAIARAKGLRVLHEDLFDHLERLNEASLGGIVATHVIEHLTPPAVRHLLNEARRVLVPGGCLVLETPNPTAIWSYAQNWGRDPTHRWAPHPETLGFMAGRAGLTVVRTRFCDPGPEHERLQGGEPDAARLNEFLYGAQNYVLVAERPLQVEAQDARAPAVERPAPVPAATGTAAAGPAPVSEGAPV
ncbi:MAG: class I SAM-dependent DNA methyltransferase, partial [Actinomycetota bacterium]